ncbi:MAG: hypothetical protein ACKVU1_08440 [bacterium]
MINIISRISLLAIVLTIVVTFATGCYTVMRHPDAQSIVAEDTGVRKACESCHQDSRFYHDAFDPGHYAFGSYAATPAWNDYYHRPWWLQDYWYYGQGNSVTPGAPAAVETGGQHIWTDPGRRAIGTAAPTPVITGGATGGGTPTSGSPGPTPSTPASDPKPEETRAAPTHRSPERRELGTPAPQPTPQKNDDSKENNQPPPQ